MTDFRGKRIDNGRWVYGFYWYIEEHHESGLSKRHFIKSLNNGVDYEVDENTVGQYVRKNDVNDEKIYEGDILLHNDEGVVGDVFFDEDTCGFAISLEDCIFNGEIFSDLELFGNIYDNPDRVKGVIDDESDVED